MYQSERSKNHLVVDSFGEQDKCSSSNETISTNEHNLSDDEFMDVVDDFIYSEVPTFEESLLDVRRAMAVFFNNDFKEALRICDNFKSVSPLHAITGILFDAYFTFFTLDKELIEKLNIKLKDCEDLLLKLRKQQPISKYFFKTNYNEEYTEEQIYYEFVQAFMLIVNFFISIFDDATILSVIKATFKLKQANNILRNCEEIIKQKENNWQNKFIENEFKRGVAYVNGGLNIVFSHLPSKVLSIISVFGFSGNRKKGIAGLQKGFEDKTTLFWAYCGIAIMAYNLYIEHILGMGLDLDATWSWQCIKDIFKRYPNSLVNYQFMARAYLTTGDPENAKLYFLKVVESKALNCKALLNLCNWDLVWAYSLNNDFLKAAEVALRLKKDCLWSPATNQYQAAIFVYTQALKTCDKQLMDRAYELMREVKNLKIRIVGKTIPWEKFAIVKSEEFLKKGYLTVPVYELYYCWNLISNIAGNDKYLNLIENDLDKQLAIKSKLLDNEEEPLDEYCLLLMLKAYVLRNKYNYEKAIYYYRQIFKYENRIQNYKYILPNACCDLGITYFLIDNFNESKKYLHSAKSDYTGYLAETVVHFKVHNTLISIKTKELKISDNGDSTEIECYGIQPSDKNEIIKIKNEIENENILKSAESTKLSTIQEENIKNSNQDNLKLNRKIHLLDRNTRSKSEANLFIRKTEFNNLNRNFNEINNNDFNYQSNPQFVNQLNNRKIDNRNQLNELVNGLESFKERLAKKQRKNSLLKRVKSLSKINFSKNINAEILKDEIEFDLQKREKSNKKKLFNKRRISIF